MSYTPIDLSQLPSPDVVEALDFETILQAMKDDLLARDASLADTLSLESEPLVLLLEVAAYRELFLRQRVNDAARAVMLAFSLDNDLEHLAALFGVERLVLDPGDPTATPPVDPTYESDERLRQRVQLALEGLSVAGPVGAYEFHTLSADATVKDAGIESPTPGAVTVTVLSSVGDGTPDAALLAAVDAALSDKDVRPLTDTVTVQAATVTTYSVDATLTLYAGPDGEIVRQAAEAALIAFVEARHRLGHDVTLSGLYAALHQPGVQKVTLNAPGITADLVVLSTEAAYCSSVTVAAGGVGE